MALTKVTGQGLETLSDGVTITVDDNSDTLTLKSTDTDAAEGPILKLLRDGDSAADDDFIGVIKFNAARDDNNSDISYGKIGMFLRDASDGSEDGTFQIIHRLAGSDVIALELDNDEYVFNNGSNDVDFRVESNGNANMLFVDGGNDKIGIGTNAPSDLVHLKGGSDNSSTGAPIIRLQKQSGGAVDDGQTIGGISWFVNDDGVDSGASKERAKIIAESQNTSSGTRLEFWTGNSNAAIAEQMRILADGSVCIGGTTATAAVNLIGTGGSNVQIQNNIASGTGTIVSIGFINDNGLIGSIQCGGSSTSYETSSDYRLKENVDYTWDATTRLKQLKPARFNFITDDTNTLVDGFLAHEVSSIVPEAISGTKDAMAVETRYTADDVETQGDNPSKNVGDPKTYSSSKIDPQGIDQSKLVPLLVKTIQELEARLTAGGL